MHSNLFHIDQKNSVQFITFRTQESISYYLEKHNRKTIESTSKQQLKLDQFLDTSNAGAILNDEIVSLLITLFNSKHKIDYNLFAVSIMPNHVHMLFEQLQPLATTMQKIKGASAFIINNYRGVSGKLWDKSYYDKVIRTEEQFKSTYQYIKNNAHSAGLEDANKRFYGVYEKE